MVETQPREVHFRPGSLRAPLSDRQQRGEALGSTAQRDLERYYTMLQQCIPDLEPAEANLIRDVLRGTLMDASTARLLWAEVADAVRLDHVDQKWGVDGPALVQRLREMTPFEALALLDDAERCQRRVERGEVA